MFAASYSWNSCLKMLCICSKLFDHLTYFICRHNTANGLFGQSKSRANPKLGFHLGTHLWLKNPSKASALVDLNGFFQGITTWGQGHPRWSPVNSPRENRSGDQSFGVIWFFPHLKATHLQAICNWYYLMLTSWMYNNLPPSIHKCHSM